MAAMFQVSFVVIPRATGPGGFSEPFFLRPTVWNSETSGDHDYAGQAADGRTAFKMRFLARVVEAKAEYPAEVAALFGDAKISVETFDAHWSIAEAPWGPANDTTPSPDAMRHIEEPTLSRGGSGWWARSSAHAEQLRRELLEALRWMVPRLVERFGTNDIAIGFEPGLGLERLDLAGECGLAPSARPAVSLRGEFTRDGAEFDLRVRADKRTQRGHLALLLEPVTAWLQLDTSERL